eukprot:Skav214487  [mRNA]  locus=scaffold1011:66137:66412:- [translate_table: standard]
MCISFTGLGLLRNAVSLSADFDAFRFEAELGGQAADALSANLTKPFTKEAEGDNVGHGITWHRPKMEEAIRSMISLPDPLVVTAMDHDKPV